MQRYHSVVARFLGWLRRVDLKTIAQIATIMYCIVITGIAITQFDWNEPKITIQGRVVDEDNNPVGGAQVIIDGQSCLTNETGKYIIQGVTEGYTTIEVKSAETVYRNFIIVRNGDRTMNYDVLLIVKPP